MSTIGPTNPFHLARAYGADIAGRVGPQSPVQKTQPASPPQPAPSQTHTPRARRPDRPDAIESIALRQRAPAMRRLIAGVVPGGVDFSGDAPRPSGNAIPLYRHPADRNAAATTLNAGRMIDIEG